VDALFNLTRLGNMHPSLSSMGAINILVGLVDLLLIGLFFKAIVKTLVSFVAAAVGALLLPLLANAAASLPKPWDKIAIGCVALVWIGLMIWAWRDRQRKRGKVEISVTSRKVRIEPRCIYCNGLTANVEEYTDAGSSSTDEQFSGFFAVLPYPAHPACDRRSFGRDKIKYRSLVATLIALLIMTVIQAILVFTIPPDSLRRDESLLRVARWIGDEFASTAGLWCISLIFMLFSLAVTGLCFGFDRTKDKIHAYVRTHSA
jgi:hypothetical protein